ncbi:hypothetical protein K0M31_007354 [Melipona bicolor]|uniref:Uncharacterized protein n=1 Tax=Melipona bicolor TaxID=60889 RepID=A0AA40GB85_9HYME|nr:hypothetical protein K0M31_007354 [Melipona bicolor]
MDSVKIDEKFVTFVTRTDDEGNTTVHSLVHSTIQTETSQREAERVRDGWQELKGCEGGGCWLEKGELMPAEGGGRQATKASMSQNVDRERRVPLPLIRGFVDNCASPRGRSCCPEHVEMITVRCDSPRTDRVPQFPSAAGETCYEVVQPPLPPPPPPVPLISANGFLARGL